MPKTDARVGAVRRAGPRHHTGARFSRSWIGIFGVMFRILISGALVLLVAAVSAANKSPSYPPLNAKPVKLKGAEQDGGRIGKIRLLGALELPAVTVSDLRLVELSDLAWDDDEGLLYALSDKGALFGLRPVFQDGRLHDASLVHAVALRDPQTKKPIRWQRSDSEGMDILHGRNGRKRDAEFLASFEREPRIEAYRPDGTMIRRYPLPAPLDQVGAYRSANRSLEAVCADRHHGILVAPEEPLKDERPDHTRIFSLNGNYWYLARGQGGIVALECLGDGKIMILERDFQMAQMKTTISLRRTRIPKNLASGERLSTETLAQFTNDEGLNVDNFEGLTHHQGNRFFMVSDNNDVFFQRSLLLYFEVLSD